MPTKKSHIILDFARHQDKQHEMQEVLFRAYFSEGRNVSADGVLKELVSEVGLNPNEALSALSDSKYIREFEEGIKQTKLKGMIVLVLYCIMYSGYKPLQVSTVYHTLNFTSEISQR